MKLEYLQNRQGRLMYMRVSGEVFQVLQRKTQR